MNSSWIGIVVGMLIGLTTAVPRTSRALDNADRRAIEQLHQQDVQATLSDKADELAQLWDRDGVRLQRGTAAEVGRDTIYAADKRWEAANTGHTISYKPDVKDIQIVGGWAFEWGYFEASFTKAANAAPETVRGKQLRILKRQADGSWKFARVMVVTDPGK